jgi:hypothetical protein
LAVALLMQGNVVGVATALHYQPEVREGGTIG